MRSIVIFHFPNLSTNFNQFFIAQFVGVSFSFFGVKHLRCNRSLITLQRYKLILNLPNYFSRKYADFQKYNTKHEAPPQMLQGRHRFDDYSTPRRTRS